MTEQERQQIMQELKDYVDSLLKPYDNEKLFPLKYMMAKYKLTQGHVARDVFVSVQTVHRWLHNKQRVNDKHIRRLHQCLAQYECLNRNITGANDE